MKKIFVISFLVIIAALKSFGQSDNTYPKSIVDLGLGIGPNFGIFGVKGVIGYRGNGLLVGVGMRKSQLTHTFGLQLSNKILFVNFCWGDYATASPVGATVPEDFSLVKGKALMGGGKINLGKLKICFIEGAIGIGFDGYFITPNYGGVAVKPAFLASVGIVVRIGDVRKKPVA